MFEDKTWESQFKKRLEKHYDELKWLYAELYRNDEQAFEYFISMLYDYYTQRKPTLKAWDETRESVPDWFRNNKMLGMLMYTNAFSEICWYLRIFLGLVQALVSELRRR